MTSATVEGDQTALRARNRERVLRVLLERIGSGATQSELADATGLSRPSIATMLGTLKPILSTSAPSGGSGNGGSAARRRVANVFDVDPDAAWAAAIDI